MEKKYVVPEGMLKAAIEAGQAHDGFKANNLPVCLEAVVRWWSENPTVPTMRQLRLVESTK